MEQISAIQHVLQVRRHALLHITINVSVRDVASKLSLAPAAERWLSYYRPVMLRPRLRSRLNCRNSPMSIPGCRAGGERILLQFSSLLRRVKRIPDPQPYVIGARPPGKRRQRRIRGLLEWFSWCRLVLLRSRRGQDLRGCKRRILQLTTRACAFLGAAIYRFLHRLGLMNRTSALDPAFTTVHAQPPIAVLG